MKESKEESTEPLSLDEVTAHSPIPWRLDVDSGLILDTDGGYRTSVVGEVHFYRNSHIEEYTDESWRKRAMLNGAFIVEAANSHDVLSAILRELAESDPYPSGGNFDLMSCNFCGVRDGDSHEPSCLWLRARKLAGMG